MPDRDKNTATEAAEALKLGALDEDPRELGYGHRAHQPDPNASYGFEPDRIRPLPVDPRIRWR